MRYGSLGHWTGRVVLLFVMMAGSSNVVCGEEERQTQAESWPADQTRQFFAELEKCHGGNKSLATKFEQEKHLKALKTPLVAQGRICFSPPDHLRFEITHPFRSVLLYDHGRIQRFEHEDGKWKALDTRGVRVMTLVLGQISQWMQGKFETESPVFETSVVSAQEQCAIVRLQPKNEQFREFLERIDIAVAPPPERNIQRITLREPGGDYTEMRFTREWHGIELPNSIFTSPDMPDGLALFDGDKKP